MTDDGADTPVYEYHISLSPKQILELYSAGVLEYEWIDDTDGPNTRVNIHFDATLDEWADAIDTHAEDNLDLPPAEDADAPVNDYEVTDDLE